MQSEQGEQANWSVHIAQWRESKLTRAEYCKRQNLQFQRFVYQLKIERKLQAKAITLVPVKKMPVAAMPIARDLVLQGPCGWSLMLTADISSSWLADLMRRLS